VTAASSLGFFGDVDGAVVCVMITLLEQLMFMKYVGNYCASDYLVTSCSQSSSYLALCLYTFIT
jgi:hypothetical protein